MTESPKPENTRICEECKTRRTIHPNSPLCASCMARRSNKPRAPSTTNRKEKKTKAKYQDKGQGEKSSPGGDQKLVIDFEKYSSVLSEVRGLAEKEMRPVDLQVIYMVREYLTNVEVEDDPA